MRRIPGMIVLFGILSLFVVEARSGDTPPPVETLIAELGHKNYRVRQAAGRALEDRGEEALPSLRQALTSNDEEIRRRVEVLTQKIERAVLLNPKRVTIQMKNQLIDEVVKELARQSGYKLQYQGGQQRRVTVEMDKVTYWQALEKICTVGGLSPGFDDQQGLVYLYQQNTISPYTFHNGPFRFVATNFNYNRYINLSNLPSNGANPNQNQNDNSLNFGFMIQSEPKVPLLSVSSPRLTKAEDENGISLLPRHDDNNQFNVHYNEGNGLYRNFQHSTNAQMAKPAKEATRAKFVRGKVQVTLLAGTKPDVVIEKLTVGKKKFKGSGSGADIEIEDVAEANKVYTITMIIRRHIKDGAEAQDYNWINGVQQKLELYDDKGKKFQSQGVTNFINNSPTSIHATYQFAPANDTKMGPVAKLVMNQWLTISHELEFEFKDLPLP